MKVIIVDDEILIREWLQFCIKDIPNLEIVGSAANGAEALALYQQHHAEIVLTDIKMPVMDGIALLHEIRKISKDSIVILLTAFSEFEYARAAIRAGASEYILKTEVSAESLKEVIQKATAQLSQKESLTNKADSHRSLFNMLQKNHPLTPQDIELLHKNNCNLDSQDIVALAFFNQDMNGKHNISSKNAANIYMFKYDDIYTVLFANIKGGNTDYEKQQLQYNFAKEVYQQCNCKLGCSSVINKIEDLKDALIEATTSLTSMFYGVEQDIYTINEKGADIKKRLEKENILLNQFYKAFLPMSGNEKLKTLEDMLHNIKEERFININKVISFCKELLELMYANDMNKQDSFVKSSLDNCIEQINESFSYESIKEIMLTFAQKHIYTEIFNEQNLSKGIKLAISYIREHYHEVLSLVDIAEYVHLNPDYFSRIFKEETGQTYIAYLTYFRLSKACEMLINSNYKVQEIAEAVGYANVSYFSTVFKKQYGCNPYEFRRGEKNLN